MELPKPKCQRCGKEAQLYEKLRNDNLLYYDLSKPCCCGGLFKTKLEDLISTKYQYKCEDD